MAPEPKPDHLKRTRRIPVRVNDHENALIEAYAAAVGTDQSSAVRRAVLIAARAEFGINASMVEEFVAAELAAQQQKGTT